MTAHVLQSIFQYQHAEQVKVLISFIEIYNEQAFDLLAESQQEPFYSKGKARVESTLRILKYWIDLTHWHNSVWGLKSLHWKVLLDKSLACQFRLELWYWISTSDVVHILLIQFKESSWIWTAEFKHAKPKGIRRIISEHWFRVFLIRIACWTNRYDRFEPQNSSKEQKCRFIRLCLTLPSLPPPENRLAEPAKKSIKSHEDVLGILAQASKRRHIRNTKMNSFSSRSHAVFTIYLGIKHAESDIRESVINIVDLAGSEGFGKAGSQLGSEAHIEGKHINESLSALRRVINAMSCGQKYIPFRDSVITTFLKSEYLRTGQIFWDVLLSFSLDLFLAKFSSGKTFSDALNSQSYLTLLGCVSPYQDDYGETLSTVRFVSEAKQIKQTPQLNAVISEFQVGYWWHRWSFSTVKSNSIFLIGPFHDIPCFFRKSNWNFNHFIKEIKDTGKNNSAHTDLHTWFEQSDVKTTGFNVNWHSK